MSTLPVLAVKVHVEAMVLDQARAVQMPLVDFSRMPFKAAEGEVNGDVPFLGSELVSSPFSNPNLTLDRGVHLHWTLPAPCSRARAAPGSVDPVFAPCPNRWLVRRRAPATAFWLVQSDAVVRGGDGVPYPSKRGNEPEVVALGRVLPVKLDTLVANESPGETVPLTAVGAGEPTFAAFYPSCRTVFGFHDAEIDPNIPGLIYDVLGWHSDGHADPLPPAISLMLEALKKHEPVVSVEEQMRALEDAFGWAVSPRVEMPERMVCYGSVEIDSSTVKTPASPDVEVAIASNGGEALSVWMSAQAANERIMEEQLEALRLASAMHEHRLDFARKLRDARHQGGFKSLRGFTDWGFVVSAPPSDPTKDAKPVDLIDLPETMAELLHDLNQAQRAVDEWTHDDETMRSQIYSDWAKYMVCAYEIPDGPPIYPAIDDVRAGIENGAIPELAKHANRRPALYDALKTAQQAVIDALQTSTLKADLKPRPGHRFYQPTEPVVLMNGESARATSRFDASSTETVPCMVIDVQEGFFSDATVQDWFQAFDTPLQNGPWKASGQPWNPFLLEWEALLLPTDNGCNINSPGQTLSTDYVTRNYAFTGGDPLEPDEIEDIQDTGTEPVKPLDASDGPADDVDLHPKPGTTVIRSACVYTGRSVLSGHARARLCSDLERFFAGRLSIAWLTRAGAPTGKADERAAWIRSNWPQIVEWYFANGSQIAQASCAGEHPNPEAWCMAALAALTLVDGQPTAGYPAFFDEHQHLLVNEVVAFATSKWMDDFNTSTGGTLDTGKPLPPEQAAAFAQWYRRELHLVNFMAVYRARVLGMGPVLSQALSGFNEALLQHEQTFHLPIDEPLGFDEYRSFSRNVGQAVGDALKSMPAPDNEFLPLRAGAMKLMRLRLVDTFGLQRDLNIKDQVHYPSAWHRSPDGFAMLPPRIVQPAMLEVNWLATSEAKVLHSNDVPGTGPICGWLLANDLDDRLEFYSASGKALGSVVMRDGAASFDPPPGSNNQVPQFEDDALRAVFERIVNGLDPLEPLITALSKSLENVEPTSFEQHASTALFFGRPLALVRVNVQLRLQGMAAVDQSWPQFELDMVQQKSLTERHNAGLTSVQFPLKLGDHAQYNDGVCGYWLEDANGHLPNKFQPCRQDIKQEMLSIDQADGLTFSVLMDPRAVLHATTGILPVKIMKMPTRYFADALKRIEVTFLTAPLLTGEGMLGISFPDEPGYDWSWIECSGNEWREMRTVGQITQSQFTSAPEIIATKHGDDLWQAVVTAGWLLPATDSSTGGGMTVVAAKERKTGELGGGMKDFAPAVEQVLLRTHLVQPEFIAPFQQENLLREGWLKLRPQP